METRISDKNDCKILRYIIRKALAVLAVAVLSVANVIAYDFKNDGIFYNILSETDRTVEMAKPNGDKWDCEDIGRYKDNLLVLSPTVKYNDKEYTVIAIGDSTFYYGSPLEFIMPETIVEIKEDAFHKSPNKLTLPNSVKKIGRRAFAFSFLNKIKLSESLEEIGEMAFQCCYALDSIVIPENIKTIESGAFSLAGIEYAKFPESLTKLGDWFYKNPLEKVELSSKLEEIDGTFINCYSLKNIDLPETLTTIGRSAFEGCVNLKITLPESLRKICTNAFAGVPFDSITIPRNVSAIEESAFGRIENKFIVEDGNANFMTYDGALYTINMDTLLSVPRKGNIAIVPEGVYRIGSRAFYCFEERDVKLPNTLKELGTESFMESWIKSIELPEGIRRIPYGAFSNSALESIVIPSTVDTIETKAFMGSSELGPDDNLIEHPNCSLKTVYCLNPVPPHIEDDFAFPDRSQLEGDSAILYVPLGSAESYKQPATGFYDNGWGAFNYAEDSIREIDFSGVEAVAPNEIVISIEGNTIIISGKPEDCPVELYDMTGRLIHQGLTSSISDLTSGIFILKVGHITKKIVVN